MKRFALLSVLALTLLASDASALLIPIGMPWTTATIEAPNRVRYTGVIHGVVVGGQYSHLSMTCLVEGIGGKARAISDRPVSPYPFLIPLTDREVRWEIGRETSFRLRDVRVNWTVQGKLAGDRSLVLAASVTTPSRSGMIDFRKSQLTARGGCAVLALEGSPLPAYYTRAAPPIRRPGPNPPTLRPTLRQIPNQAPGAHTLILQAMPTGPSSDGRVTTLGTLPIHVQYTVR